jgi:hypothetical protein
METISALRSRVAAVEATRAIASALSKARRALRGSSPDAEAAQQRIFEAVKAFDDDLVWRRRAQTELLPGLRSYDAAISGTIGLRSQARLPDEQALFVAACQSNHRDISLSF